MPLDEHNLSDHLPMKVTMTLKCKSLAGDQHVPGQCEQYAPAKWDNYARNATYRQYLETRLKNVTSPNLEPGSVNIQTSVDSFVSNITQAIHNAAQEAGCTQERKNPPKSFWCPRLAQLRDKKRFWWRLWGDNGRPRSGTIYECYKNVKKLFRKTFRQSIDNSTTRHYTKLQQLYTSKSMRAFWNEIRNKKRTKVASNLQPNDFKQFYSSIMQEDYTGAPIDSDISQHVDSYYAKYVDCDNVSTLDSTHITKLIDKCRHNASPGVDGITAEHLQYGKSDVLCNLLTSLFNMILSHKCIPSSFCHGVIVPLLKKPTLNPNQPENYRPITISTTLSKILEFMLIPDADICDTQLGFREGGGTPFGSRLLSDTISYFKYQRSPIYVCSLDAEKCFDNICHTYLFYKLIDILPFSHWVLCYKWYSKLTATVKWLGKYSVCFKVTKGTRQGSILSPYFFNVFINDLLIGLRTDSSGVAIGNLKFNSFTYADDVTVYSTSATGLQMLIDRCYMYSQKWRFKFGIKKTKCIVIGKNILKCEPEWFLGTLKISKEQQIEILGTTFTCKYNYNDHVDNRIRKCRQAYYSLTKCGMAYPGATADVKSYLWKSICAPVLMYGHDGISIGRNNIHKLDTAQGNLVKQAMGLSKRAHTTELLLSLGIRRIDEGLNKSIVSLYNRMFKVNNPLQDLTMYLLSQYITHGTVISGTIIDDILNMGLSPTSCIFNNHKQALSTCINISGNGHVDSIRALIHHENFIKPYSEEHTLVNLLTKSF
jgi:hypothetical protein